jgi:dephospho-CoA kinase
LIVAGLTGGISSGKSTVSSILGELGAQIIDADRLAREAVEKDTPAYAHVVAHFGSAVLQADGTIDRKRLGGIIFSDPHQRRVLEGIVHPWVREETDRQIDRLRRGRPLSVVILDVPLLFESGMHQGRGLAEIIVVYAPENVQTRRLAARDGLTEAEALNRIRTQMPIEHKKALATRVIDNSGRIEDTRTQTVELFRILENKARLATGLTAL